MIYILFGANATASRDFLLTLRKKENSRVLETALEGGSENQALSSYLTPDLFSQKVLVVLDITKVKDFDFEDFAKKLDEGKSENDFVFYSPESLRKTHALLKIKFKSPSVIKEFTEEIKPNVFVFLDALFEKRKKDAYSHYFSQVSQGADFELLSMVSYGLRNIAMAVYNSPGLNLMHSFVKSKAQSQAKNFTKEEVAQIYKDLYTHDLNLKTGKSSIDVVMPLLIEKIAHR